MSVETRTAYPLMTEQLVRGDVQKTAPKAIKPKNLKPGRPKGSVNKNKKDVELSPFQTQLQACIRGALALIGLDLGIIVSFTMAHWGTTRGYRPLDKQACTLFANYVMIQYFTSLTRVSI